MVGGIKMVGAFFGGFAAGALASYLFSLYLLSNIEHKVEKFITQAKDEMLKIEGLPAEAKHELLEILNRI
jgi:hypothetical protein